MESSGAVERFWFRDVWPNQDVMSKKAARKTTCLLNNMGWMGFYVRVEEDSGEETND